MGKHSVLVVEDQIHYQEEIRQALEAEFEVHIASGVKEGHKLALEKSFDVILLDLMLGDGDGFSLFSEVRQISHCADTPILFLSANDEVSAKIMGLTLGADDYVTKPFNPLELKARVLGRVRKTKEGLQKRNATWVGDFGFFLDKQSFEIKGATGSTFVDLTPIEFKLLHFLARSLDKPVSRAEILQEVWGANTHVLDRSVDTYVAALRKKLGPWGTFVKSVHGVGYKLSLPKMQSRAS